VLQRADAAHFHFDAMHFAVQAPLFDKPRLDAKLRNRRTLVDLQHFSRHAEVRERLFDFVDAVANFLLIDFVLGALFQNLRDVGQTPLALNGWRGETRTAADDSRGDRTTRFPPSSFL
jgi:hypothetical protein